MGIRSQLARRLGAPLRRLGIGSRRRQVDIVYSARYRLDLPGLALDPRRGEKVLGFLASEGLIRRGSVLSAPPMPLLALCRVHDVEYLESLSDPETLTRILGFRPDDRQRQLVVEVERRMCGGTRLALQQVLSGERARATGRVALHLGGGLHHAFPDRGPAATASSTTTRPRAWSWRSSAPASSTACAGSASRNRRSTSSSTTRRARRCASTPAPTSGSC